MDNYEYRLSVPRRDTDALFDLSLPVAQLESFRANWYQLNGVSKTRRNLTALCAVVDLEGFTDFCVAAQSTDMRNFIKYFTDWFIDSLCAEMVEYPAEDGDEYEGMYCRLPIFVKFLGDGFLLAWDTDEDEFARHIKGAGLMSLCDSPESCFSVEQEVYGEIASILALLIKLRDRYPGACQEWTLGSPAPEVLRVGIARGEVYPVFGGGDFVGQPINLASRLQKLSSYKLAISATGLDRKKFLDSDVPARIVQVEGEVRGFIKPRRLFVLSDEFDANPGGLRRV